jgi:hypothetical protein
MTFPTVQDIDSLTTGLLTEEESHKRYQALRKGFWNWYAKNHPFLITFDNSGNSFAEKVAMGILSFGIIPLVSFFLGITGKRQKILQEAMAGIAGILGKKIDTAVMDSSIKDYMSRRDMGGLYFADHLPAPAKEGEIADGVRINYDKLDAIIVSSQNANLEAIKAKFEEKALASLNSADGSVLGGIIDDLKKMKECLNKLFAAQIQGEYSTALQEIKNNYSLSLPEVQEFPEKLEDFKQTPVVALKLFTAFLKKFAQEAFIEQLFKDCNLRCNVSIFDVNMFDIAKQFGEIITGLTEQILDEQKALEQRDKIIGGALKADSDKPQEIKKCFDDIISAQKQYHRLGEKIYIKGDIAAIKQPPEPPAGSPPLSESEKLDLKILHIKQKLKELFPFLSDEDINTKLGLMFDEKKEARISLCYSFFKEMVMKKVISKLPFDAGYSQVQGVTGFFYNYLFAKNIGSMRNFGQGVESTQEYWIMPLPPAESKKYERQESRFYLQEGKIYGEVTSCPIRLLYYDDSGNGYEMLFNIHEKYHIEQGVYVLDELRIRGLHDDAEQNRVVVECVNKLLLLPNPFPAEDSEVFIKKLYDYKLGVTKILLEAAKKLTPLTDQQKKGMYQFDVLRNNNLVNVEQERDAVLRLRRDKKQKKAQALAVPAAPAAVVPIPVQAPDLAPAAAAPTPVLAPDLAPVQVPVPAPAAVAPTPAPVPVPVPDQVPDQVVVGDVKKQGQQGQQL